MGKFFGGLALLLVGGAVGYALAKAEEDRDVVERTYRKAKRSAQEAVDRMREENPEEAEKLDQACQQVANEFRRFKGKLFG